MIKTIGEKFKGLTKRERVMITFLIIVFVLAILIFLIILPALTSINTLQDEVDQIKTKETQYRTVIAGASTYQQTYDESRSNFDKMKKQLYQPMEPESLDETITAILVDSGFTPGDLVMTQLNTSMLSPYIAATMVSPTSPELQMEETTSDGATDTENGSTEEQNAEATDNSASQNESSSDTGATSMDSEENLAQEGLGINGSNTIEAYTYIGQAIADGEKKDLYKLIDKVNKTTGMEIIKYEYNDGSKDITTGIKEKGNVTITFALYVYIDFPSDGNDSNMDSNTNVTTDSEGEDNTSSESEDNADRGADRGDTYEADGDENANIDSREASDNASTRTQ